METVPARQSSRTSIVALVAIVIVLGAAFGFYYIQSSGTISTLNQTTSSQASEISSQSSEISTQASQITSQVAQLGADNAKITNLTSNVSNLQSKVASLQAQVTSDEARITSLIAKNSQANQTIASLSSQVSSLNTQISSLNGQITSDESQVSTLQSQVASLQAMTGLSDYKSLVSAQVFATGTTGDILLTKSVINNAGYIAITVTSASDYAKEGWWVMDNFSSSVNSPTYAGIIIPGAGMFYPFSSQSETEICPVVSGTIAVYLATSDTSAQSATLSVVYYY
jgi:peptidoglycan hydrolase CwlO-like protein